MFMNSEAVNYKIKYVAQSHAFRQRQPQNALFYCYNLWLPLLYFVAFAVIFAIRVGI